MNSLVQALGVRPGDVVSFTGAGGKTSAMFRLAAELAGIGRRVVVTTTTHIHEPYVSDVRVILLETQRDEMIAQIPGLVERFRLVAVAPGVTPAGPGGWRKLQGLRPGDVDRIAGLSAVDNVLVEADGAKGRSLKAPAAHEPVVPPSTTLLVPLAAMDVVGRPLDESRVHRPEVVSALLGHPVGGPVTTADVAAILANPLGGLKGCPSIARVVPFLNKAETPRLRQRGLAVALALTDRHGVQRVAVGALANRSTDITVVEGSPPRVRGAARRVAAVVLAAGESKRFGGCKQLADIGGQTLVARTVGAVLQSAADELVVVAGSRAAEVAAALDATGARVVVNEDWQEGIGSSMRCGLADVAPRVDAALFVLADQVRLTREDIDVVLGAYRQQVRSPRPLIVAPVYGGRRGNPVLFDRAFFPELLDIEGDQGGRAVMARHPECVIEVAVPTDGVLVDVDYPWDLTTAASSAG